MKLFIDFEDMRYKVSVKVERLKGNVRSRRLLSLLLLVSLSSASFFSLCHSLWPSYPSYRWKSIFSIKYINDTDLNCPFVDYYFIISWARHIFQPLAFRNRCGIALLLPITKILCSHAEHAECRFHRKIEWVNWRIICMFVNSMLSSINYFNSDRKLFIRESSV